MTTTIAARYVRPSWFTRRVFNPAYGGLTKFGISLYGAQRLHVTKRVSGGTQVVPVNPMTIDGGQYLVAPRGETQWVRNLRVAGMGVLTVGRTRSPFVAIEIADDSKALILREYLRRWGFEVGQFFEGIDPKNVTVEELAAMSHDFPVFMVQPSTADLTSPKAQ